MIMETGCGCSTRHVNSSTNTSITAGTTVQATSIARGGDAVPSGRCARARNADRTMAACDSAQHSAANQKITSETNVGIISVSCRTRE